MAVRLRSVAAPGSDLNIVAEVVSLPHGLSRRRTEEPPNDLRRGYLEALLHERTLKARHVAAIRPQPITARGMRASDPRIARMEAFDDLTVVGTASLLAA